MSGTPSPWESSSRADPHPTYKEMRQTASVMPLFGPATGRRFWFLTSYAATVSALRNKQIGKQVQDHLPETVQEAPDEFDVLNRSMLSLDPPDHTRLRRLVSAGFTPRAIAALEPRIREISSDLLASLAGRDEWDLINDYAFRLPVTVIAELLGVPVEDHDDFRRWSKAVLFAEDLQETQLAALEFMNYMNDQINLRRAEPTDDLISGLVHAEDEGDHLSHAETLSMILLLLIAGHETTVNLIGNGTRALLQHRDQLELLTAQPELLESAIEELLRFDGPVEITTLRWAFEDVYISDILIPAGEIVVPTLLAANRDPELFERPDTLDIRRSPNQHIAFGSGIHLCLGSALARLEATVAFGDILRTYPSIEPTLADSELSWNQELFLRGMKSYPISVGR